jgi:CubicO group peptidase (beta-lactamase class C family)
MRGAALLAALAAASPAAAQTPTAETVQALEARIPQLMEAAEIPGLSVALLEGGEVVWSGAFGVAGTESGAPVHETTVFEAASLSKPVFAYAVLRLADRGEFDLDAPLWDLWEHERLTHDERARRITARMVITHSSGLPNWGGTPLEFNFDPGSGWGYSGEGFVFLQRAVEAHTGISIEEIAGREVFAPLGMTQSHYVWVPAYDTIAAQPHDELGYETEKRRPDDGNAAASLHTTARDYARFVAAILSGEGLSPEMHAATLTPQVDLAGTDWGDDDEPKAHLFWGLGFGIQQGGRGTAFWHWGDNLTQRCYVVVYPDDGRGVVYFTNSENGLAIAEDLVGLVADDDHWALRWLDYPRYDQLRRLARISIRRAFLEDGFAAGQEAFQELKQVSPEHLGERDVNSLGYFLLRRDHVEEAIWVFRDNTRTYPESSNVWDSLGEGYMTTGEYDEAIENYTRSLELDSSNDNARRRIEWMRFEIEARENPVTLSAAELERCAGTYGPRIVTFRDGHLYYAREGSGRPELELRPLTRDVFMLDEVDNVRFRFVSDESGSVLAIEGIYLEGRTERHERDH